MNFVQLKRIAPTYLEHVVGLIGWNYSTFVWYLNRQRCDNKNTINPGIEISQLRVGGGEEDKNEARRNEVMIYSLIRRRSRGSSDGVLKQFCFIVRVWLLLNTVNWAQGLLWIQTPTACLRPQNVGPSAAAPLITLIIESMANWRLTNSRQSQSHWLIREEPSMNIHDGLNANQAQYSTRL